MLRVDSCQERESLCSEGGGLVGGGEVCLAKRANWQATGVRRFFAERKSRMVLIVAKKGNLLAWRVGDGCWW